MFFRPYLNAGIRIGSAPATKIISQQVNLIGYALDRLMRLLQRPFVWFFTFTVLFLLSLDFWRWDQAISLSFGHLPSWLFYFVILQVGLVIAIAGVSSTLWQQAERDF